MRFPRCGASAQGDNLTALVRRDFLGRNLEWVWEVQRDGVAILIYDQTQRFLERSKERTQVIANWAGVLSMGLLVAAILLRMHFGAWRDGANIKQSSQPRTQSSDLTSCGGIAVECQHVQILSSEGVIAC